MTEIIEVTDLNWNFTGRGPHVYLGTSYQEVDPFPAYPHELEVVKKTLKHVQEVAPLGEMDPAHLYVLHHEPPARTNGWASDKTRWNAEEKKHYPAPGYIVLAGKRIPPHPAMTRYLVAHEYGHHVDYAICAHRGSGFDDEYAKLRGFTHDYKRYGGGTWHANVGEFIANDFRILIAGTEKEFWPHPGFARPEQVEGLTDWWTAQLDVLG